jgi:hypothetical protein
MVEALVWLGTLVFAATGALKGVEKGFDLLGVLVLATVTAVGEVPSATCSHASPPRIIPSQILPARGGVNWKA